MFPPESLQATINLSVQQIYNEYKWSWLFVDEEINTFTDLTRYYTADIVNPVKYVLWLEYDDTNTNTIELFPEHSITQLSKRTDSNSNCKYVQKDQLLYLHEEHDYILTYIKDYVFQPYATTAGIDIPIPNKCIPALYYLVLSQLNLIDVQQLAGQPANNFNKYQYEIKNLKANDMWYEAQLLWANPQ